MKNFHFFLLSLFLFFSCSEKNSENENPTSSDQHFINPGAASNNKKDYLDDGPKEETSTKVSSNQWSSNSGSVTMYAASASNSLAADVQDNTGSANSNEILNQGITKKIIQNANIRFQVGDYHKSSSNIEKTVKNSGGYISSSRIDNNNYGLSCYMTIRINSSKFEDLINQLMKESKFLNYKNITAEDVTEQYVDTETRLKTKKEVEKRYLEILKQAKTINEILNVEGQLGNIREEIEAKEGQLKLMNNQVNYSTIQLEYYESLDIVVEQEDGFFGKIKKGIVTGWDVLVGLVVGVFYVWPFLLLGGFLFFLFKRWRKKNRSS